jgi:two-component system, NarL family, sensor histidine kinase UhpB
MAKRKDHIRRQKTKPMSHEREYNFDALLNSSSDMIWMIDSKYSLVLANSTFYEWIRTQSGKEVQLKQQLPLPGLNDSIRQKWKTFYDRALFGERFTIDFPVDLGLPLEGKHYEVTFNPVYDSNWTVVGAGCFSKDVSERKKMEGLARKNASELAEAQKLAQYGNWSFDLLANRVSWSEELYNIFGTDKQTFDETHGSFINLVDEEDRERVLQTNMRARVEGVPFDLEYGITTPAGEKRHIRERGYADRNCEGKIIRLFGTAQNITLYKKEKEERESAYRQLREVIEHLEHVREEERKRIAREIHDDLSQQLRALKIDVDWICRKLSKNDYSVQGILSDINSHIDATMNAVSRISSELRLDTLDYLGLNAALVWQGKEFEKRTGIQIQFFSSLPDFNPDQAIAANIFRIYQEALTNVARHSKATRVESTLALKDGHIEFMVKDNGQGFDVSKARSKNSFGLIGMKERALMSHGELVVESNNPKGTTVLLRVPASI